MSGGDGAHRDDDIATAETQASDPGSAPTMTPAEADTVAAAVSTGDTARPRQVAVGGAGLDDAGFGDRYRAGKELGRGGMGEVQLFEDGRIGRQVALKRMRDGRRDHDQAIARFVREARVQGQLEHPAIVPVYDMGVDPDGAPYFTMKRLRGLTLEQIITRLAAGDDDTAAHYSRRKLLTGFSQVCQAVDFAHRRGVIHRDLKPNNVMLGDFGEVYVLDWGVARVTGEAEEVGDAPLHPAVETNPDVDSAATAQGAVMGTPGYMAPEQMRGEVERTGARADIYSLGAILFELLTLEPLHPRSSGAELTASTLAGADARARERAPEADVPPELEAMCVRATALEPEERYASVHELVTELEGYLDGDRDLARRRELAIEHAEAADHAATTALTVGGHEPRVVALREAGRALALDPDNARARHVIGRLLTEPPAVVPDEVEAAVDAHLMEESRLEARSGRWIYLFYFAFAPAFWWMGIKNRPLVAAMVVLLLLMSFGAHLVSRAERIRSWMVYTAMVGNFAVMAISTRLFGPFVLIPGITAVGTIAFLFHHKLQKPWITISIGVAQIAVPAVLELTGVLSPSYGFENGRVYLSSHLVNTPPAATFAVVMAGATITVVVAASYIYAVRRSQVQAERRLQMQAWQLRQLMPEASADSAA